MARFCKSQLKMPLSFECLQFVLQDHNYGAPPPQTPPPLLPILYSHQQLIKENDNSISTPQQSYAINQAVVKSTIEDDAISTVSSGIGREPEIEGEETETAPEAEEDDDSITRCICEFQHDDGYMICCDRCLVWQHVDCMGIDRTNIPDEYLCEMCRPRRVDKARARALQMRKREELFNSDSSSDSSSSSADARNVPNENLKNRNFINQQHHKSVSKRITESSPQKFRLNNNNNINNRTKAKKPRKTSQPLKTPNAKNKKEVVSKTSTSLQSTKQPIRPRSKKTERWAKKKADKTQDSSGSNVTPLRHWIDRYEEAVTNHYSPELRARISNIKINGTHNDFKQNNIGAAKCCINIRNNDTKCLVATVNLPIHTSVIELRGKYMLSTQHRYSSAQHWNRSPEAGNFVFYHRLPQDGTEVCVDTRTYGNDARFVRRSCKPNAEIKHCIEKGTLHLYIVSNLTIEKNEEITIRHDEHDLTLSPNATSLQRKISCACNDSSNCQIVKVGALNTKENNDSSTGSYETRDKKQRMKKNSVPEEKSRDNNSIKPVVAKVDVLSTTESTSNVQSNAKKNKTTFSFNNNLNTDKKELSIDETLGSTTKNTDPKKEKNVDLPTKQDSNSNLNSNQAKSKLKPEDKSSQPKADLKKEKRKMTREERKMEAIMKAFERLEKAEQRKQEVQARNAQRKESGVQSDTDEITETVDREKLRRNMITKGTRRKKRKGRTRSSNATRKLQSNSAESDYTSSDENHFVPSSSIADLSEQRSRKSSLNDNKIGNDVSKFSNANSTGLISPPSAACRSTPIKSPSMDSNSSQGSIPSTPLSSACLLVAAAVGPLAPGFKFPKTKKLLMNEWLREAPDPQYNVSDQSGEACGSNKSFGNMDQTPETVTCDSSPQRMATQMSGSAKKRWLRQAISEEYDSPSSPGRTESPPSEMLAPPKKRRIARESLSSDNYTPPTTPTMMSLDNFNVSMVKSYINEADENDHQATSRSENTEPTNEFQRLTKEPIELKDNYKLCLETIVDKKDGIMHLANVAESKFLSEQDQLVLKTDLKKEIKSENDEVKFEDSRRNEFKNISEMASTAIKFLEAKTDSSDFQISDKKLNSSNLIESEVKNEFSMSSVEIEKLKKNEKINKKKNLSKGNKVKFDIASCIDELDVEAQMKKLTGDDGEDNVVNIGIPDNFAKDKVDGIKGLIESSNEDSRSEKDEKESENLSEYDGVEKFSNTNVSYNENDEKNFQELESIEKNNLERNKQYGKIPNEQKDFTEKSSFFFSDKNFEKSENEKISDHFEISNVSVQNQISESNRTEAAVENYSEDSSKAFPSILPLSERIRKRAKEDSNTVLKSNIDLEEVSKIESSLNLESTSNDLNYKEKHMMSLALKELIETEIVLEDNPVLKIDKNDKNETKNQIDLTPNNIKCERKKPTQNLIKKEVASLPPSKTSPLKIEKVSVSTEKRKTETSPCEPPKLKDPRTVVPNKLVQTNSTHASFPVKRKLSISEYRKRKQQTQPSTESESTENAKSASASSTTIRKRSDSASSRSSSMSSEDDIHKVSPDLKTFSIFTNADGDDKKGTDEGHGWSAEPTLVEQQRENLTERLKREFGLFLNEDEEENARKLALCGDSIEKTISQVSSIYGTDSYPTTQLPPQPYIPPPGSSLINYTAKVPNPEMPFSDRTVSANIKTPNQPLLEMNQVSSNIATKQILTISQAPPGSNPYPPHQLPENSQNFIGSSQIPIDSKLSSDPISSETKIVPISQFPSVSSQAHTYPIDPVLLQLPSQTPSSGHNHPLPKS